MKKHDKEFKLNAVNYYLNHKELGRSGCAKNLGVGNSTLSKWVAEYQNSGDIEVRGSGNFQSDEAKENAPVNFHWNYSCQTPLYNLLHKMS